MIKNKRGAILIENIVFIILNLIFLTILVVFLLRFSSGTNLLEENYAKQIALLINSAKPGMEIYFGMDDAFKTAEDKWGRDNIKKIVNIDKNRVTVRLTEESSYSYSFFNNIDVGEYGDGYFEINTENKKGYIFIMGDYK